MKKRYYFFSLIFLFLAQLVNAQDPNLYSKVYQLTPPSSEGVHVDRNIYFDYIIGIENVDNDPEKEIITIAYWGAYACDLCVYDGISGILEWHKRFNNIMTKYSIIEELQDSLFNKDNSELNPRLVDINKDGKYEILIYAAIHENQRYDDYNWYLYSLGGSLKPLIK
jgi:hypothetical protein